MTQKIKLEWEGEKVRQSVKIEPTKFTPKEMLDGLDHVRNQITAMKDQKTKMEEEIVKQNENIKNARAFELERAEFETKCVELNTAKLNKLITQLTPDLIVAAEMEATKIIEKDPSAYDDNQKTNQKYVIFQKMLATHKKVAEKISNRLITNLLFDTPIFENPFK